MNLNKENILKAFEFRHACKEFDVTRKISEDDFNFLLKIISLSPSSFGLQPYEIFVLQNEDLLKQLHPHMWGAKKQLFSASHVLMFAVKRDVLRQDEYSEHMLVDVQNTPVELRDMRRNLIEQHELNEIKVQENRRFLDDWTTKQAYIALGNVMSVAAMIGIDSCPVEGFIGEKVTQILVTNQVFDPTKYAVGVFCCLGYRLDGTVREKIRKPITELVRYI